MQHIERTRKAHHAAGHALARLLVKQPFAFVTADDDGTAETSAAHVAIPVPGEDEARFFEEWSDPERLAFERSLFVALAGEAAEGVGFNLRVSFGDLWDEGAEDVRAAWTAIAKAFAAPEDFNEADQHDCSAAAYAHWCLRRTFGLMETWSGCDQLGRLALAVRYSRLTWEDAAEVALHSPARHLAEVEVPQG